MYEHLLRRLKEIAKEQAKIRVLVVSRYDSILDEIQEDENLQKIYSIESKDGASYSIRNAVRRSIQDQRDACAFFVADQPWLQKESVEGFLRQMQEEKAELGCVCHNGKTGNPAWFTNKWFPELMQLEGDQGGKTILKKNLSQVHLYPIKNAKELLDIDTR